MDNPAIWYRGDGEFAIDHHELDGEPAPNALRLAVAYVGVCGTDLHVSHGHMDHRVGPPSIIGHEMSAVVHAVGGDVTGWTAGDRCTVVPLDSCGDCPACHAGNSHVCHRLNFIGVDSHGAMQRYWDVPAEYVVRLPADLDLVAGALTEPVAVAAHDVRLSGLSVGDETLVVGAGPIGLLIALVARASGASVTLSDPNRGRLALARDLGFDAVDPAEVDVIEHVEAKTGGAGADVTFEVSGVEQGLTTALHALRVRGTCVVVAIHNSPPATDLFRVFWRELRLIGTRVYERVDFERAAKLLVDGVIPVDRIVSEIYEPARVDALFDQLDGGSDAMKLLIDIASLDRTTA